MSCHYYAHIDADCFFCQCHTLGQLFISRDQPLVVQQQYDIISVNYPARTLGIEKHQSPNSIRQKYPQVKIVCFFILKIFVLSSSRGREYLASFASRYHQIFIYIHVNLYIYELIHELFFSTSLLQYIYIHTCQSYIYELLHENFFFYFSFLFFTYNNNTGTSILDGCQSFLSTLSCSKYSNVYFD